MIALELICEHDFITGFVTCINQYSQLFICNLVVINICSLTTKIHKNYQFVLTIVCFVLRFIWFSHERCRFCKSNYLSVGWITVTDHIKYIFKAFLWMLSHDNYATERKQLNKTFNLKFVEYVKETSLKKICRNYSYLSIEHLQILWILQCKCVIVIKFYSARAIGTRHFPIQLTL